MAPKRPVRVKRPKKDDDMIYDLNISNKSTKKTSQKKPVGEKNKDVTDSTSGSFTESKMVTDCSGLVSDISKTDHSLVDTTCPGKVTFTQSSANCDNKDSNKPGIKTVKNTQKKAKSKASATISTPQDLANNEHDEAWAEFEKVSNIAAETVEMIDKKIAEKNKNLKYGYQNGTGIMTEGSIEEKFTNENNEMASGKSPAREKRPKRLSKLRVKYNYSEEDFTDEACTPKKGKKRKVTVLDEDYNPRRVDEEELPDIDILMDETNKQKVDEIIPEPAKKKSRKGKGKGQKKTLQQRRPEQQILLDQWKRKPRKSNSSKYVEVLNGRYRRTLYGFQDNVTFKVKYKDEKDEDKNHYWDSEEYNVEVKIDMPSLRDKLLCGELCDDDLSRVFRIVKKQMKRASMRDYDKPRVAPPDCIIQQPKEILLELKRYQLDTLGWMKRLEDRVERGFTATKLVQWEKSGLDLEFDVVNKRVFVQPLPISNDTLLKVHTRGGILADQMGLGKTITLLGLISLNKATFPPIPDPKDFNYQETFYLPTKASLVVAPSHLTGQWKDEVESHTENFKVLVITTKYQYEKITYVDILEADVVVVSVQFLLTNKVFTSLATGVGCETDFMKLMRKPGINPLLENGPNLMHFKWWRIIADEAHEIMTYDPKQVKQGKGQNQNLGSQGLQTLSNFKSQYRWYVTGTPFPHAEKSLRAALKVSVDDKSLEYQDGSLQVDKCETIHDDFYDQGLFLYPLHHVIYNHLYVRNTKGSIGRDYDVPEYIEELILLTMGDVERGIYDRSISDLERRQLCCHLQIAARIQSVAGVQQKTLDEVRVALVDQTRKDIDRTAKMIESCEKDMGEAKKEKDKEWDPKKKIVIQNRILRLEDTIKRYNDEMTKHNSALSYFDSIVPRINHNADEPCVICLETIERLTVTPCGHMYCRKCIIQCLHSQGLCPTCRKSVHESQLLEVHDAQARDELAKSAELKNLTEKYGTKMAYLIFYLRNLFQAEKQSRVIIFSQWDSLLHKIGETLDENLIKNVFVKGNVHVRNKAIMSFRKQEKTRVIMLSLQNAASGTNLVEATHVILIDPVAGSPEEAIAIESQAIGRAHRMGQHKQISVVRMIMKDTVEHEVYKRNSAEDDIQQVEFDFEQAGAFGGPQIVRRTRTVPEPDPAVLQQAIKSQEESSRFLGSNSRRRRFLGWNTIQDIENMHRLQNLADSLVYEDNIDYSDNDNGNSDSDEMDYSDDDMWGYRRRGRNDCVIS